MFSFNNDTPIYLQIVDLIRNDISSGKLKPGQKLPSVREYALEFKVNPNTICKAMQILEDKKIISLDMATLVSGTKYRGELEERLKQLIDYITSNKDVIVLAFEEHIEKRTAQ